MRAGLADAVAQRRPRFGQIVSQCSITLGLIGYLVIPARVAVGVRMEFSSAGAAHGCDFGPTHEGGVELACGGCRHRLLVVRHIGNL